MGARRRRGQSRPRAARACRSAEALDAARQTLALRDGPEARDLFLDCVIPVRFTADGGAYRTLVLRALAEGWDRPSELMRPAVSLLRLSAPIRTAPASSARRRHSRRASRRPTCSHPRCFTTSPPTVCCCRLLESAPVADAGLEKLLVNLRSVILARADAALADDAAIPPLWIAAAATCGPLGGRRAART